MRLCLYYMPSNVNTFVFFISRRVFIFFFVGKIIGKFFKTENKIFSVIGQQSNQKSGLL